MNEPIANIQPELYTLIVFLNEVNERTEKSISGLSESLNKIMPSDQVDSEVKVDKSNLGGALGDFHDQITRANKNCRRLDELNAHFKRIV